MDSLRLLLIAAATLLVVAVAAAAADDAQLLDDFKAALPSQASLDGWAARDGACRFPGAACRGGRLTSLSLAAVPLNADFRAVAATLLQLSNLEKLSLRAANVTGVLALASAARCGTKLEELDLSGNAALRGSVADVAALAGACGGLRTLNLSGDAVGAAKAGGGNSQGFAALDALDLSSNKIAGDADLRWMAGAGIGSVRWLDLAWNRISGGLPDFANCSGLQYLDLSGNLIAGDVAAGALSGCRNLKSLNLSSNHLAGAFPPNIPNLTSLTALNLSNNNFSGEVPADAFAGLRRLQSLSLSFNHFNGSIPDDLAALPDLEVLDLSSNNFAGAIPSTLCRDPDAKLRVLYLQNNFLTGTIPEAVSNCSDLVSLDLSLNFINGSIPESLGQLARLQDLIMWQNSLEGEIPASLSSIRGLEHLILDYNGLTGSIPPELAKCTQMNWISLASNRLSGPIPSWFGKLSNLAILKLGNNSFTGRIPAELGDCKSLVWLDLNNNQLSGSIPPQLADQSGKMTVGLIIGRPYVYLRNDELSSQCRGKGSLLEFLNIRSEDLSRMPSKTLCNFTRMYMGSTEYTFNKNGSIPESLGQLARLQDLIMWQNSLEGEIPASLSSIRGLEHLILDYNGLTGSIPPELAKCTQMNWISLASNRLSGPIPPWFGKLSNLAILKLGNNSFTGQIPAELGDCKSLVWLDLNNNQLSGSIPPQLADQSGKMTVGLIIGRPYVYLRNDELSSQCRGKGSLLEFLNIRSEDLSRMPSKTLCNFTRMYMGSTEYTFNKNGSMIFLDLSFNQLDSEIPKELGNMYYLMIMNLGHNLLSGAIPTELAGAKMLAVLDLAHNQLEGPIPSSFSSLSLSEIDLSSNKLNGTIPELGSLSTFPKSQYENNTGLCGFPLPNCQPHAGQSSSDGHGNKRKASLAGSIAMGLLFSLFCIFGLVIIAIESKKRRQKNDEASTSRDIYIDSRSHSGTMNSNWRLSGTNALSINLAAFEKPLQKLTLGDLVEATNGFHNDSLIGSGGFGDVYKAQLKDGRVVAVKKLIHVSGQGDREFTAEMETIGKIKHRNLVPLLGYCKIGEERLLMYDFMKFGSLEDVLHDRKKTGITLNWAARRTIAIGAARGLAFLHHNCIPHIIHRDMKSSNVLVDENLEARVSDFGMARMMSVVDTHLSVSTLAGTPGYVPPEYYQSFRCTTKGDVYSYGVVLLELLTGKPPTDSADFGEDNNLVGWVKMHTKLKITDVFDPELLKDDPALELELLEHLKIACACLDDRPSRRPTMLKVMAMFKEIQAGSTVDSKTSSVATGLSDDPGFGVMEMTLKEAKEEKD